MPCQPWEEIDAYEVFICRSCGAARIAKKDVIADLAGFFKNSLFISEFPRPPLAPEVAPLFSDSEFAIAQKNRLVKPELTDSSTAVYFRNRQA